MFAGLSNPKLARAYKRGLLRRLGEYTKGPFCKLFVGSFRKDRMLTNFIA